VAAVTTRAETLLKTWEAPAGIVGWLSQVNHKAIATRYFVTSIFFFFLAGVSALIMRVQLAQPELNIISPELYNQLFSTHGTAMMFLFAIPMLEAVGMYLIPLMIGSRDMIFPRLNAFGYWVYLIAGLTVWTALFLGNGPNAAWFNYVPLATSEYTPGLGVDVWTTAITFMEIAALVAAVEMIATIFKLRAPGMSLNRMPILVWSMLVMSFMIIFAMPAVMLASVMLFLDRSVGTGFFNPAMGGDPLLWQHLFWIFGHPEVYIILIPGLGIVSAIVSAFARRGNTGYSLLTASFVAIGFLSFGLWVHHMYTAGLPWMSLSFFEAASMSIAIPSGIAIFSWIATLWGTRPEVKTPLLYILGFFFVFILGGITGVMVASIPFNHQVHDTYFVVAHFHYVLIGSAVFPLFGALHFWFPKISGKLLDEGLGKLSFWLTFIGFNLTFFPMHISGFLGMPRQVYTYRAGLGWENWNLLSTVGAFVMGLGAVMTLVNILASVRRGEDAGPNPWGAGTLEWAAPSPPPPYNWEELPRVTGRYPLWTDDEHGRPDPDEDHQHILEEDMFPQEPERRETPGTRLLDSRLERNAILAGASIFPLFAALSIAVAAIGSLLTLWLVPVGVGMAYVSIVGWLWPKEGEW
jgi:cytochrome c oxidase subunit I+III